MTYSVYNIKVDNELLFTPGPTAGYVLGINADGSTSWVQGGGGSQTLEQVLAQGNDVGTYSIIGTDNVRLSAALSEIHIATNSVYIQAADISNSATLSLINNSIYLNANDLIELYGKIVMNGPINGTGSNFLTIDNVGNVGSTSSTPAGTSGTSGAAGANGSSGTSGVSGTSGTSPAGGGSQTLEQTLALGNNPGTYSIETFYSGDFKRLAISATYSGFNGVTIDNTYLMTGTWSNFGDVYIAGNQGKYNMDTAYLMISNNYSDPIGGADATLTSMGNSQSHQVYVAKTQAGIIAVQNAVGGLSKSVGIGSNMTFGNFIYDDRAQQGVNSLANKLLYVDNNGWITGTTSTGGGGSQTGSIGIVIDGAGTTISTGVKASIEIPYSGTITGWTILADQVGSIVVDVWKDNYATYPPSSLDSIAGSEKPTLSSAQKNQDNTLTTWTTSVTAGDIITFNVDSVSTLTRVNLAIKITKS